MKDYTPENPVFSGTLKIYEVSDPAHADDVMNVPLKQLHQNTLVLYRGMQSAAFDDDKGVVIAGSGGGGGGGYILPTATATRLGGVKIGEGIDVENDGTISANVDTSAEKAAEIAESEIASATNDFTDEDIDDIFNN